MFRFISALIAAAAVMVSLPAAAQSTHDNWRSFQKDGKCWASTAPASSVGSLERAGKPYLAVLNHPGEGVRGSVAMVGGYESVSESDVMLTVDGESFDVLPFGTAAFTGSGKPEANLIAAMRKGRELVVVWSGPSGAKATDTYSLKGFGSAKADIDARCP